MGASPKTSSHWADELANRIIASGSYLPYWVDDMKTPSGRVHIGSVRAVVTHNLIYRALQDKGQAVTFSYVLDDHDPMDSLPVYLNQEEFRPHLGKPLHEIPSPDPGYASYGRRWGEEYIEVFNSLGVNPKIYWGSELYRSGKMNEMVRVCLDATPVIRQIYQEVYGKPQPADWYPFAARCEGCGKLSTTTTTDWDGTTITYECRRHNVPWTEGCGHQGKTSPLSNENRYAGKLPWKIEWACKWRVLGVTIEGAGKDHMTAGGSFDIAKRICERVIHYPVPFAFAHEFFLVGGRKMSSSKGLGSSAKEVAQILPPYLIRFLIAKFRYTRAIDFDPGGMTIPDLFDQYDAAAQAYWGKQDPKLARLFVLSQVAGLPPARHFLPRFRDVATAIQHPEINESEKFAALIGKPLSREEEAVLKERMQYAKLWLDGYAPEEFSLSPRSRMPADAKQLTPRQRSYLQKVGKLLEEQWEDPALLQERLFAEAKKMKLPSSQAFGAIYLSLIGKQHGPRAAWLLLEHRELARKRFQTLNRKG